MEQYRSRRGCRAQQTSQYPTDNRWGDSGCFDSIASAIVDFIATMKTGEQFLLWGCYLTMNNQPQNKNCYETFPSIRIDSER